jgi:hypothetical protein
MGAQGNRADRHARRDPAAVAPPKTRSGKIMRRILRKIAKVDVDLLGDVSKLADPTVVDTLILNRIPMT